MSEPKRLKYEPTEVDYSEVQRVRDRFCKLMGWEKSSSHKFEVIRKTLGGKAVALGIAKADAIADRIEALEADLAEARRDANNARNERVWQDQEVRKAVETCTGITNQVGLGLLVIHALKTVQKGRDDARTELRRRLETVRHALDTSEDPLTVILAVLERMCGV